MKIVKMLGLACTCMVLLATAAQAQFQTGTIIEKVTCEKIAEQSYALYLPTAYTPDRQWPIIYLFTPGANGPVPIREYKQAAERYGYILAASNNSRNGSWKVAFQASNAMFDDTWARLSIDTGQVYTSGFSGGARVATAIAMQSGRVAGVIACGAGFPVNDEMQPHEDVDFAFVSLCGNRDMNLMEMSETRDKLDGWNLPNHFVEFEGPHKWPSADTVQLAIEWIRLQAIKAGRAKADDGEIKALLDKQQALAGELAAAERYVEAQQTYASAIRTFDGLTDISALRTAAETFAASKEAKKALKERKRTFAREAELQREYRLRFLEDLHYHDDSATVEFWKEEGKLVAKMCKAGNPEKALMGKRLMNQLWARCYEMGQGAILREDFRTSATLHLIWTCLQPDRIYPAYRLALDYAKLGIKFKSLTALEAAVRNGMKDPDKLQKPEEFDLIRAEKRFKKLENSLQQ